MVVGTLTGEAADDRSEAEGRISRFREETRETRIQIAERGTDPLPPQGLVGRCARRGRASSSPTCRVPVMTRLRQPERQVLDTLVDAGVARSRSEALAWVGPLVGEHTDEWLGRTPRRDVRGRQAAEPRPRALIVVTRCSAARRLVLTSLVARRR